MANRQVKRVTTIAFSLLALVFAISASHENIRGSADIVTRTAPSLAVVDVDTASPEMPVSQGVVMVTYPFCPRWRKSVELPVAAGGAARIDHPDGHTLEIPAGASGADAVFMVRRNFSTRRLEIRLEPEGTAFSTPVNLKVDFSACRETPAEGKARLVHEETNTLVPSSTTGSTITASLNGFSTYVLAEAQ